MVLAAGLLFRLRCAGTGAVPLVRLLAGPVVDALLLGTTPSLTQALALAGALLLERISVVGFGRPVSAFALAETLRFLYALLHLLGLGRRGFELIRRWRGLVLLVLSTS